MDNKTFLDAAKKRFGDKIHVGRLNVTYHDARLLGFRRSKIVNYPEQAWIPITENKGYLCPICKKPLGGIFGTFTWGICHGFGFCSNCKKANFHYYHYIAENKRPLQIFALCGF